MSNFYNKIIEYFTFLSLPELGPIDIVEMLILAFAIYKIIKWVKKSRAWTLGKGLIVLFVLYMIAFIFDMNVILWIFDRTIGLGITALIIVFQPELRKALEQLGERSMVRNLIPFEEKKDKVLRFSDESLTAIVKAVEEMGRHKTGALITIERNIDLDDNIRSGIKIDSAISSQLIMNIFEHNTPLHDGGVIIRDDRIVAATCYYPLSDNYRISKELGTRHRAALGISEISDGFTIIVSEETGDISVAVAGMLERNIDGKLLTKKLQEIQGKTSSDDVKRKKWFTTNKKETAKEK
ncbi:MAG: diadenylate cyclase CdaA [Lachnospiraceae bacterium]|nr:diadenylate cyclase CdaA [Lachnospiraceae bacterium]